MAKNFMLAVDGRNAALTDGLATILDGGYRNFYSGTIPALPETALVAQVLLTTMAYADPAYGAPSVGVATADLDDGVGTAGATGGGLDCTFFRDFAEDDTLISQGTVGATSDFDCVINDVTIHTGDVVSVTVAPTITCPRSV